MTVYYLCCDNPAPTGGNKKTYHHVDILNRAGVDACVLHFERGFRYRQFENATRVSSLTEAVLYAHDVLVVPEDLGPESVGFARGVRKVLFNQNAYYTFRNYPIDRDAPTPYLAPEFLATLVVSDDSRQYLEYVFPSARVVRVHNAIDAERFAYDPSSKRPRVAFAMRKHPEDVQQVVSMLRYKGLLDGFELAPIANMTEAQVAETLRTSLLYLSFGYPEGCPLSVAEAMACGCVVVGYHGMGGRELFDPGFSHPVENGEVVAFARAVERVIETHRADPAALAAQGARAAAFIRREYSAEREADEVVSFWRSLLGG